MSTPPPPDQPEEIFNDGQESPAVYPAPGPWDATIAADGSDRKSDKPAGQLESNPIDIADHGSPAEVQGELIGRYKLLQQIGEGGFGTVWMAEQTEPVTRRVALKIIKLGMDTREVIARFEQERQALAMMDHPNIAKVLDAGATDKGRPFFVMELVKGMPVTQYCDEAGLGTRDRLALFGDVCSAIQHAHQKGIIHRDIKPSNVMVTLQGDKPVVKVIDFGIAKATQGKLTDKTLFTLCEQFIGTPVYMSPEQASLSGLDIDTRSDIYGLGVLLYELLTGKPPFDARSLISAGFEEMRRIIREVEPPRPSSRLSTVSGEERLSVAKARRIEPEKLSRVVEPDLDWIVMKAIDKDRTRRYETASAFAQDIAHFLADEPVSATPPSVGYQFRKFARRNRAALRVAATIAAVLVTATAVSTWQAVRATRAEKKAETSFQLAEQERKNAEASLQRAEEQRKRADEEAELARTVNVFLQYDILRQAGSRTQADSGSKPDPNLSMREALERAAERIGDRFKGRPLVEAAIRMAIGDASHELGNHLRAIEHLEVALALRKTELGPDHPHTLTSMNSLASAFLEAGKLDEALPLFEETLRLSKVKHGPEHPHTLSSMNSLSSAYLAAGRLDAALPLYEETLRVSKASLGPDHPSTLSSMNNLAIAYRNSGKPREALPLNEESFRLTKIRLGQEHPNTLIAMNNLANAYRDNSRMDQALPLYEELLRLRKTTLGPEHPQTLTSMNNLAGAYQDAGKWDLAIPLYEDALRIARALLGPEHPGTPTLLNNLATSYQAAGKLAEAIPFFEEAFRLRKGTLGAEHPHTFIAMNNLAVAYRNADKLGQALPLFEETLRVKKATLGSEHPDTLLTMVDLGLTCEGVGQYDKAEPLLIAACEGFDRLKVPLSAAAKSLLRDIMEALVRLYTATNRPEQVAIWQRKLDEPQLPANADEPTAAPVPPATKGN